MMTQPGSAKLATVLADGAQELGIALDGARIEQFIALGALLLDWNTRINLTAIREPLEVARKHVLDSLAVLPHLRGERVADVGSGAGFPGLALALADPGRQYTLIEATTKKARFIEHAVAELRIGNVAVVNSRAELWRPPEPFAAVLSRALGSLAQFVRVAGHLATPSGRLYAMKGRYPQDEIAGLPSAWRVAATHCLTVPGLEAERHLIVLERRHAPRRERL